MVNKKSGQKNTIANSDKLPIIGIGASAGGLKALKEFFKTVPKDSGLAYVVVMHLSPHHKSMLAELLQPHLEIPVTQVQKTLLLEPNKVYVIPPNANLNTIDTHLRLSELEEKRSERAPIDHFFRTLASAHGGSAIGIVLTGTGSDGALGIKAIKEKGGLTIIQDPKEAEYDGMPKSALATGMVDKSMTLGKIYSYLKEYLTTSPKIKSLESDEADDKEKKQIQKIFAILKQRANRDFSEYKLSTLLRRLQRRMQMYRMENIEDYLKVLEKDPTEPMKLSDDFLINVTHFFRDPESFNKLEEKILPIFENKKQGEPIRVWSVGCATGEEAYSVAIMLYEISEKLELDPAFQIFATDLHVDSLQKGREGFYTGEIRNEVSKERLKKFFLKENGGYRIREEIRERVVFAPHNLLSDPPFSRLDLLVCRNLLIYLKKETQNNILDLFHYALLPEGLLFLGPSERCDKLDLFNLEDKHHAIYSKLVVESPEPKLPVFPSVKTKLEFYVEQDETYVPESIGKVHGKIMEHFGPPSLLMNIDYKVLHLSDSAGRYLRIAGGEISNDVFKLMHEELHPELRSVVFAAKSKPSIARSKPRRVKIDGKDRQIVLSARAVINQNEQPLYLVMFEEYDTRDENSMAETVPINNESDKIQLLEDELGETRERLQSIIEEYETSREEMKASNEEMQSSNEELRSTMEELETSKEELQSMNEELTTINQENRHKVQELNFLSDDLQNFMAATDIASLFLDKNMRILRFTPKLEELFNIRPVDKGRPISDQTHNLVYDKLIADGQKVLKSLQPVEKEVNDKNGNTYLTRILPYRTSGDEIKGIVVNFVDITPRKEIENKLVEEEARFRNLLKASSNVLYRVNADWSKMLEVRGHGFVPDTEQPDKNWLEKYVHPDDRKKVRENIKKSIKSKTNFSLEHRVIKSDGSPGWVFSRAIPMIDSNGEIEEWFGAASNIESRKVAENELKIAKEYAEKIIETLHEPLLVLTPDLTVKSVNNAFYEHFNVNQNNTIGRKIFDLGNGQWNIPSLRKLLQEVLPTNEVFNNYEVQHQFEDIGKRVMLLNARRLDHVQLILLGIRDITGLKKEDEDRLRESEERLQRMINVEGVGIVSYNSSGKLLDANNHFLEMVGFSREELESGKLSWKKILPNGTNDIDIQCIKELIDTGKIGPNEKEYIRFDGSISWMMYAGSAIGGDLFVDYCLDIADKKQAERALEENQQRMKITLQSIEMGSWEIYEGEDKFLFDEGCLGLFGFPPDNKYITLDEFYSNIHQLDKEKVAREFEKSWEETGYLDTEFRMIISNGQERWFASRGKIIEDGGKRKMIGVNYEISKTKKYQQALQKAKIEAEKAARAKDEFLAHMSHEIRTPLNAVIGISHLLHEKKTLADQLDNLRILKIAADNLGTIINDILDYSKIQAGKVSFEKEFFNLNELVENIISIHKVAAEEKGLILNWQIDKKIKEDIVTDKIKLSHVLHNLLSNAVKFTMNGEVKLNVELKGEDENGQIVCFSVSDTGIGIPEDNREKIFDVFSQGDSSTVRQFGGSGLGLTIVKLYIQMMGSDIKVDSEPGVGSNFYFTLNLCNKTEVKPAMKKEDGLEEKINLDDMKILLVEDDEYNQVMVTQFFDLWGVQYATASNGVEAVEMAMANQYDIVLMDIRMPGMDGYMATKEIRKIKGYQYACIIALTADISERVKNELAAGTFTDVSIKPINSDELRKKMAKGVGR